MTQTNGQNLGMAFAREDEAAGTIDGYQWCLDNWGTKWGDCHTRYEVASKPIAHATFYYDTAWAPADFGKIAKMYPNLTFITKYEEGGMGFVGAWAWKDGECVFDHTVNANDPIYPDHPPFDDDGELDDSLYEGWLNAMSDLVSMLESQADYACSLPSHDKDMLLRTTNKEMVQRSG
jgi:hypothetical protein